MDYATVDVIVRENSQIDFSENFHSELNECQLALIGGGVGEVVVG
jgi:hypothetical protein